MCDSEEEKASRNRKIQVKPKIRIRPSAAFKKDELKEVQKMDIEGIFSGYTREVYDSVCGQRCRVLYPPFSGENVDEFKPCMHKC